MGRLWRHDMIKDEETLDEWFMRAVLLHEAALTRYLYRNWRDNPSDVKDLCQEVLTRVYSAAQKERPAQVKSFIFSTARNLLTDMIRRARVVRIDTGLDLEAMEFQSDEVGVEEQVSARQELLHLQRAMQNLPVKCRQVVELRRVHGYSQKETASQLGITESAVESHIQRGVWRLAEALRNTSEIAASRFDTKGACHADQEKGL